MAVAFSVVSWNVEHFGASGGQVDQARLDRVVSLLKNRKPDVFAIYEVESSVVFDAVRAAFPKYSFHITEGPQTQEILVAAKSTLATFFSQRLEFTSGSLVGLRPGALLTVTVAGQNFTLLFLHTKSIDDPRGFGLRAHQLDKAFSLKRALDRRADEQGLGPANYLFLGDLNSMGMNLTYSARDVSGAQEIDRLRRYATGRGMRVLPKTKNVTFWNGPAGSIPKSNLDHVVAAEHLTFTKFAGGAEVKVHGWPTKPSDSAAGKWIDEHSDHALLEFKVHMA